MPKKLNPITLILRVIVLEPAKSIPIFIFSTDRIAGVIVIITGGYLFWKHE